MTVTAQQRSLVEATSELITRLEQMRDNPTGPPDNQQLVHRIEIEIGQTDPLLWLDAQPGLTKTYWRSRDESFEFAGLNCAHSVVTDQSPDYSELAKQLAVNATGQPESLRYFGGFRFDPFLVATKRDPRWSAFGSYRLVLHRFELVSENSRQYLACNVFDHELRSDEFESILEQAAGLTRNVSDSPASTARILKRDNTPARDKWLENVHQALGTFKTGPSQKLVLSRRVSLAFSEELSPWQLLYKLREVCENCFLFGVQPDAQTTFIGASPERLFQRHGHRLKTEAIAGTRSRGHDQPSDDQLGDELMTSEKERWEHDLVVTGLRNGLEQVCSQHTLLDGPTLLKLSRVQHLQTRFEGELKSGISDFQIIAALHPSPAVGGFPVDSAPALLHQYEPFDRGWYAGLVGWVGTASSEFAVGIRSALQSGKQLDLFSGAGIVADSDPESEWNEVEQKIGQFLHLTNGNKR